MGQGYSLTTLSSASAGIDVPELGELVNEKTIGSARFLKTIRARHHDGVVLVKALLKPYTPFPLTQYREKILTESKKLAEVPNALPFQRVIETETNGYLVRQFIYHSLYDRISTRPFLEDIEKKWLAFQLLCALKDCHQKEVYHGDIKSENILVTSWNWLYLSDFSSSFKPTMLPEDNPADFSYFFDTSARRTCYIAPERFVASGEAAGMSATATVDWAMDIFSTGCVLAELFLESPIFSLHQIFKYRKGEYDPVISHLSRIPDKEVRDMISTMIQLEPEKRYSADDYLRFFRGKVFPEYFYNFLHQYMGVMTDPFSGQKSSSAAKNQGEADERIDRVFYDFDKISYFLGYRGEREIPQHLQIAPRLGLGHLPIRLNIPNNEHVISDTAQPPADDGTLIFLNLIVSSLRNCARAASKVRACDILLAFSERLTDEAKLDRVLPYLVSLLNDPVDVVIIAAIRSITQLLSLVKIISPINANIFTEYLFHRFNVAVPGNTSRSPSPLVRATYASCLGSLAHSANRFLDMASALNEDGSLMVADPEVEPGTETKTPFDGSFDTARRDLFERFELHTKALIEDSDPFVRRAFLSSVPELCMFFGLPGSNDIILTHLNTYLNDRDWMLKCAFFDTIVGIGVFVGTISLEEFILPLMVQALTDPEEHVVQAALHSLAELASLGLFSQDKLFDLVDLIARFTMHPNYWIRESAAEFLAASGKHASVAVKVVMLHPRVKPYLRPHIMTDFLELQLLDTLKKPISRTVFDQAVLWAQTCEKGLFWRPLHKLRRSSFGTPTAAMLAQLDLNPQSLSKVPRNEEDDQWLAKLRKLGMIPEDEPKLLALREFIWRLSQIKSRESLKPDTAIVVGQKLNLNNMGAKITTVMFDEGQVEEALKYTRDNATGLRTLSLEDALQEATATNEVVEGAKRRKGLGGGSGGSRAGSLVPVDRRASGHNQMPMSPSDAGPSPIDGRLGSSRLSPRLGTATEEDPYSQPGRRIRHQSSAISLINRKDSIKSVPETGTTQALVFGEVEAPYQGSGSSSKAPISPAGAMAGIPENIKATSGSGSGKTKTTHDYEGNDPNVKRMLDNMYVDNFPYDMIEFGPLVTPIHRSHRGAAKTGQTARDPWKPAGTLVATFAEHKGAINRIVVSPDHVFFLTGSDDGTVKVWDTARLEKNPAYRSRQTHRHAVGVKVTGVCFVEGTHAFVSCGNDGSVHVVKVDCVFDGAAGGKGGGGGVARYSRTRLLREFVIPTSTPATAPGGTKRGYARGGGVVGDGEYEYAVWCEHYRSSPEGQTAQKSLLLLATNRSRVLAIDLKDMSVVYVLENPVRHGTPTCFCLDRKRNWLVLGTSHGVLDLWDLRFRVRLRGWGVGGRANTGSSGTTAGGGTGGGGGGSGTGSSSIFRLGVHPTKGKGKWVCCSGGTGEGEITVWDLEKGVVREVYRVAGPNGGKVDVATVGSGGYEAWDVDDDKPEGMLGRFATAIDGTTANNTSVDTAVSTVAHPANAATSGSSSSSSSAADKGVRGMVVGSFLDDMREVRTAFIVTGGGDKRLRFWDLGVIERSCVFSGLGPEEGRMVYGHQGVGSLLTVHYEKGASSSSSSGKGKGGTGDDRRRRSHGGGSSHAAGGGGGGGGGGKPSRSSVISVNQQYLLRSHLDAIMDVVVVESPYSMVVSGDRSGVVFVFA